MTKNPKMPIKTARIATPSGSWPMLVAIVSNSNSSPKRTTLTQIQQKRSPKDRHIGTALGGWYLRTSLYQEPDPRGLPW